VDALVPLVEAMFVTQIEKDEGVEGDYEQDVEPLRLAISSE
jgi:hypothetical protein